ncbi:hypothetical protein Aduo_012962 [Ancylostoma duodenale]
MDGDHPTLSRLIEVLRDFESEAESALTRLQQVPSHGSTSAPRTESEGKFDPLLECQSGLSNIINALNSLP